MKTLPPLLLAVLAAAVICPAGAVVVTTGVSNTSTPVSPANPFFANVGQLNGASAVYLGNGWVLTADHVAGSLPASVTFGGTAYATQAGSWQQLLNPTGVGLTTYADIVLFRLSSNPVGLSPVTVSAGVATVGDPVMMIGNGRQQSSTLTTWNVATGPGPSDDVWTEGGTPTSRSGFKTTATQAVSWGQNVVTGGPVAVNTGTYDTISFNTTFDQTGGLTQEGQAVNGDSGGAAFYFNGVSWELIGMTHAVATLENQPTVSGIPGSTAVYGDQSYFAELGFYAPQIATITAVPESSCAVLLLAGGAFLTRRRR